LSTLEIPLLFEAWEEEFAESEPKTMKEFEEMWNRVRQEAGQLEFPDEEEIWVPLLFF